jgi:uncharacterized damage-inducible protein DinB
VARWRCARRQQIPNTGATLVVGTESQREALESFLDAQREGLIRKIEGLDDETARRAPTASSLSLLGLVKHAATWERRWFQIVMGGREFPDEWPTIKTEPRDADLMVCENDTVDHWVVYYREQIEQSRAVAASMDLDSPCARTDIIECNVRYVLFHMIEETARHASHADIIRETLDGSRGF